jgi:phage shock protein PspC (stress-responsive transcriptional regulator)
MSITDELERLDKLRATGALSETEYAQAKAHALGGGSSTSGSGAGGAGPGSPSGSTHNGFLHRLTLSATDRVVGGVCGGLGAHTGLPSWAWRVIFCATVFYFGVGLLFYILLWIFIPRDGSAPAAPAGS